MKKKNIKLLAGIVIIGLLFGSTICFAGDSGNSEYTTGSPWMYSSIEGTVTGDTPANPKDDYYLYANREKLISGVLTDEKPEIGTANDVQDKVDADLLKMYTDGAPESHDARLVYDLYHLAMDWEARDALGIAPLKAIAEEIEAISSIDALNAYFTAGRDGLSRHALWRGVSTIDPTDSDRNIIRVGYCILLTNDPAEYIEPTPFGTAAMNCEKTLAEYMLCRIGYSKEEAKQKIENCQKLEAMLAPTIPTQKERSNPDFDASQNVYVTRDELKQRVGSIPVLEELEEAQGFSAQEQYLFACPEYFVKLNEVYTEENLPLIKDYLLVHNALTEAPQLDHEAYDRYFHMYDDVFGASNQTDAQYAADVATTQLHWAVARLYTEKYLKQADKERITLLVDEIIEAYHDVLNKADWISDETRARAIEKLDAMDRRILYPDNWADYSYDGLDFKSAENGGNFYEAYAQIQKYAHAKEVRELDEPENKKTWASYPHDANCGYMANENAIYIQGAFAQGGIYSSEMSDEELYGRLGMVIGHEVSHAFDIKGSQYDRDGNQIDWWTEADKSAFRLRNKKMIDYFNAIHPWKGENLDGQKLAGEACADITAMQCILGIAARKPDFDYDTFFRAYADMWFSKMAPEIAAYYLTEDVHPPKYLRINVVCQQFDEFLETYGIGEGDNMYLAPEDRIVIW